MRTRRRRAQHHWTRNGTVTPQVSKGLPAPAAKVREPARESRDAMHLGPYESSYEIALGYGFERAIVTP